MERCPRACFTRARLPSNWRVRLNLRFFPFGQRSDGGQAEDLHRRTRWRSTLGIILTNTVASTTTSGDGSVPKVLDFPPDPPRVHVEVVLTPESRHSDIRPVKRGVHVRRLLRGPRCLRSRKLFATRGLNEDHNHELKNIFKGAATTASARPGPFHDFYAAFSPWRARSRRSL